MVLGLGKFVRRNFGRSKIYFCSSTFGLTRISYLASAVQFLIADTLESKMSQSNKLPDRTKVSDYFDNKGKRHVLPLAVLTQLSLQVKDKKELFIAQILKEGFRPVSADPSAVSCSQDCNKDASFEISSKEDKDFPTVQEDLFSATTNYKEDIDSSTISCSDDINGEASYVTTEDINRGIAPEKQPKPAGQQKNDKKQRGKDPAHAGDGDGKPKSNKPNFFVSVQVTDPQIHSVAKKIQEEIQKNSKAKISKAIIAPVKFHVTLMVMNLADDDQVKMAVEALEKSVPPVQERTSCQPVTLDFEGLSTFNGGRVLFADLKANQGLEHLHFMADEVSQQMKINGIVSTDKPGRKLNPHLTLVKFEGGRGVKKLERNLYEPFINEVFGVQTIDSVQLCHMNKKREDGYYFVEHEVFLKKV